MDKKLMDEQLIAKEQPVASFEQAEAYINSIPRFTSKNTMEDTKAFLHRLGDPDRTMRIIHVAGTNGKGSVCAYLNSILRAAGYSTAVFTSPHLVDIRERFSVNGELISKEDFLRAFLFIYERIDRDMSEDGARERRAYHPTFFEYLFFMAMVLFAERKPDFCILETGLGGRLDATNAVEKKELVVITRISLEHVEYLGDTLEKIAGEKAGIMCAGAPAVYWDTCAETSAVFERRGADLGISVQSVSKKEYSFSNFRRKAIDFSLHTRYYNYIGLTLNTVAAYQMENAALAVRALEVLDGGRTVTAEQIRRGVAECFWAGRMEEVLPEVYVDGAHNADGIRAFLESVAMDGHAGARTLLFSVVREKDYEHMTEELVKSGLFRKLAVVRMRTGRAVELKTLKELFDTYPDCACETYENVAVALQRLLEDRGREERIYIAGSLYLTGEIKELLKDDKFRGRTEKIPPEP